MGTKSKKKNQSQRSQKKFQKTMASLFFWGVFLSNCHLALALNEFETRIAPDSYEIIWKENPCSQFQDDLKSLNFHKAKKITQNNSFFYENSSEPSLSLSPSQNQECRANIEPFFEEPTKLLLHHKILFKGPYCCLLLMLTKRC